MKVKLIGMTTPCGNTTDPTNVIYAAMRQCYHAGWVGDMDFDSIDPKQRNDLLFHVINSGHDSTLEHLNFTFAIEGVSRALTHQLVRHRIGCSYSQQSQRYTSTFEGEWFVVPSSITIKGGTELLNRYIEHMKTTASLYNEFVAAGVPKEDARFIIPNAAKSNIVVTMNIRAINHFLGERLCRRAQWEIRRLAVEMQDIMLATLPTLPKTLFSTKCLQRGYCPESDALSCGMMPTRNELDRHLEMLNTLPHARAVTL